jgi:hypothetical protein
VDATPLLALVCGPGQGPRFVVTSLGNPVGPASTTSMTYPYVVFEEKGWIDIVIHK